MLQRTESKHEFIFSLPVEVAGTLHGLVTVPTGFDPQKESLPVILSLHGAGERGPDLQKVRVHGVTRLFSADPDYHGLRVITLSPQCPPNMVWNHLVFPLRAWLLAAVEALNGDKNRISITGLSMGGYGTWEMLTTFPGLFCCGAPVCGGGMPWRAGALKGIPLRVFHGIDDPTVPVANSMMMAEAARRNGADVELYLYDKVGHGSWGRAYYETDLIEWLASHRLSERM